MHLHFEKSTNTKCDCSILSLSWMGKVPDDIPEVSVVFLRINGITWALEDKERTKRLFMILKVY